MFVILEGYLLAVCCWQQLKSKDRDPCSMPAWRFFFEAAIAEKLDRLCCCVHFHVDFVLRARFLLMSVRKDRHHRRIPGLPVGRILGGILICLSSVLSLAGLRNGISPSHERLHINNANTHSHFISLVDLLHTRTGSSV